jgi:hypothetical protein
LKGVESKMQFGMETVVYKQLGNLAIHADVYYPLIPSSAKMSIGKSRLSLPQVELLLM